MLLVSTQLDIDTFFTFEQAIEAIAVKNSKSSNPITKIMQFENNSTSVQSRHHSPSLNSPALKPILRTQTHLKYPHGRKKNKKYSSQPGSDQVSISVGPRSLGAWLRYKGRWWSCCCCRWTSGLSDYGWCCGTSSTRS